MLRHKFTDKEWRVSMCIVMVQHRDVVFPRLRPLPSHCLPQTLQDFQVELFIDCLTTWNKLIMNDTIPINKIINIAFKFERL